MTGILNQQTPGNVIHNLPLNTQIDTLSNQSNQVQTEDSAAAAITLPNQNYRYEL